MNTLLPRIKIKDGIWHCEGYDSGFRYCGQGETPRKAYSQALKARFQMYAPSPANFYYTPRGSTLLWF